MLYNHNGRDICSVVRPCKVTLKAMSAISILFLYIYIKKDSTVYTISLSLSLCINQDEFTLIKWQLKSFFLSGYRYQSPHVKALSTGWKDYFLKPFPLGTRIISSSPFHSGIRIISSYKSIGDGHLEFEKNYGQTQKIYPWSKRLHHF